MSHHPLQHRERHSRFHQVCRKAVPQEMNATAIRNSRKVLGPFENPLCCARCQVAFRPIRGRKKPLPSRPIHPPIVAQFFKQLL